MSKQGDSKDPEWKFVKSQAVATPSAESFLTYQPLSGALLTVPQVESKEAT